MEKLVLDGDVVQLCKHISGLKKTNVDIQRVKKLSVKVFVMSLIHSKNTYIALFLEKKLKELDHCTYNIYHKLCCEILVFLATINKSYCQTNFTNQCDNSNDLQDKFLTALDLNSRVQCINSFYKKKEFSHMWNIALLNSPNKAFIHSLIYMNTIIPKKIYFLTAFNTLYETYYLSTTEYNTKLLFQCMFKMSYLIDDELTLKQKMYIKCLEYVPKIQNLKDSNFTACLSSLEENNISKNHDPQTKILLCNK
jgi:hypothetical protein|tara:strand:- start:3869 stop:4624 length:756 start_codon:yes stop_codon:yes gene_type:complete